MNATIAEVGLAPGKSMRAYENVLSLEIDYRGMFGDREYMWVEAEPHTRVLYKADTVDEPGTFLSQREDPVLTQVIPLMTPKGLFLNPNGPDRLWVPRAEDRAENRIPVSVWEWSGEAVDQGDEAAAWGEQRIGRPVRLVAVSDEKPRYVEDDPALGRVGFADGYPVSVGSIQAYNKMNAYLTSLGRPAMPYNRSRSTILLDNLEDIGEHVFPEDYVKSITIASNGLIVVLKRIKACARCPIPDTDQITGIRRPDFRSALGKLGRAGHHLDSARYGTKREVFFTQNFIINLPADIPEDAVISIAKGAEIEVEYSDTTNWIPTAAKAV